MIYLALTHDWELRGDGSGDIEEIQFAPLRRLLALYEKVGARTTFMPDVMQQIVFRRLENEHDGLRQAADRWDQHAREAYRRGHDVQLHLHSQWSAARYESGTWQLDGQWSMLKHDRPAAERMLSNCQSYLENLLRPLDPKYRCLAFRASALAVAPSNYLLSSLADVGIEIDVSMAAGLHLNNETLQLDYRECDEGFVPYYPKMDDARRVSGKREPIVCVPLNHFYASRREVTRQNLALVKARVTRREAMQKRGLPPLDTQTGGVARVYEKLIAPALKRKYFVSDLSRLNYKLMVEMLKSIRQRARATGLSKVPVVLTNHPKDIRDWNGLAKFVADVSKAGDVEFITLSELASGIKRGEFAIRQG
jgi:hypothetical protein